MKKKSKYTILVAILIVIVGVLIYGFIVDRRICNYPQSLIVYDDLTMFEKIVCKVRGYEYPTRSEIRQELGEAQEKIEYKDIIKDYDNFNKENYCCKLVKLYGKITSIKKIDKNAKMYEVSFGEKKFMISDGGERFDSCIKVGEYIIVKGGVSIDNGILNIVVSEIDREE